MGKADHGCRASSLEDEVAVSDLQIIGALRVARKVICSSASGAALVDAVLRPYSLLRGPPYVPKEYALQPRAVPLVPLVLVRFKHEVDHFAEANHYVPALVFGYPLVGPAV